ncbi:MAG: Gfo/Idh/MocA family oxidoreductase [Candidatus Peribacteraceae bacterium]|nr:Gfo/Idh/MocA family oxidoreductase [Candidatus Peribacteraceae bacterium]MDD5740042.1 Gfo/Idh/MocA family oxidoreductase [Candidatus Peribacteraceae bacterium]
MTIPSTRRALVLGGGSIGTRHTRNLLKRGISNVTIADPDPERCRALTKELGIRVESDEHAAFASSDPDIVFVCSPTALHVPQALRAVEAGAHVFIEKPLSHTMEGARELQKKSREKKHTVMVGCNMRFHPGIQEVKRLLAEGAIGVPVSARIVYSGYLPSWRPGQDYKKSYSASVEQGGAVLDCIHEIDLALWEFGPGTVTASKVLPAAKIGLATDGEAEIILKHTSGTESSIHISFMEEKFERSQGITGTAGSLSWDFERGTVERYGKDGSLAETIRQPKDWESNQMFLEELDHFLHAVEHGTIPMGSLDDAIRALEIALTVKNA